MNKPRRFKLRNGIIVEEWDKVGFTFHSETGYIDDYKIIDTSCVVMEGLYVGSWLCLGFNEDGFPIGGAHGHDFDITEEVPSA